MSHGGVGPVRNAGGYAVLFPPRAQGAFVIINNRTFVPPSVLSMNF